ncbi:glycerate kinase [Conexibacter sp. CPCC 206217]|uniref:glycerate kinase family protein n=1 Tax=Conexibacter sp. CPCC 206217 TaxID=3064574 RepID=UPI00271CCE55|nr:glycerate kinase [Conexibacter sp. CPCC 206217]MDO8210347.1 glycerate kinase [Conexibacter sp. CPCC 206217]
MSSQADETTAVLCAPDKLRGALDARAAAAALARGVRAAGAQARELPIADGGEGTLEVFLAQATVHELDAPDALGRPARARIAELPHHVFVVEAAEAIALGTLSDVERDVERASSAGVGVLIRAALDRGAQRILVAVGGVATVDGGAGMLHELGARCARDGGELLADQSLDLSGLDPRLRAGVELELLVDVAAPLTGPDGAARRFGPQKGASARQVEALDAALGRWARSLGVPAETPGAGAAGGLGAALQALGARTRAGAEAVLELTGFDALLDGAALCLTAEGSVDASTLQGKAVAAVVARCTAAGVPVVVLGGRVEQAAADELRRRGARAVSALGPSDRPLAEALAAAGAELEAAARAAVAGR